MAVMMKTVNKSINDDEYNGIGDHGNNVTGDDDTIMKVITIMMEDDEQY